jgi:hypothetical protein
VAFNYDLASADADVLLISKVRLEIGDTDETSGAGVKPDGSNFTDAEITYWLDENGDDVSLAAADACAALARHWARASDLAVGPRRESLGQVSKRFEDLAAKLRRRAGKGFRITKAAKPQNIDDQTEYTVSD